jgi:hypothetical protein
MELEGSPKQIRNPNARSFKLEDEKMVTQSKNQMDLGELLFQCKKGFNYFFRSSGIFALFSLCIFAGFGGIYTVIRDSGQFAFLYIPLAFGCLFFGYALALDLIKDFKNQLDIYEHGLVIGENKRIYFSRVTSFDLTYEKAPPRVWMMPDRYFLQIKFKSKSEKEIDVTMWDKKDKIITLIRQQVDLHKEISV